MMFQTPASIKLCVCGASVAFLMKQTPKTLYVASREEWRAWLEENHARETEVWLVYYKKHTNRPRARRRARRLAEAAALLSQNKKLGMK